MILEDGLVWKMLCTWEGLHKPDHFHAKIKTLVNWATRITNMETPGRRCLVLKRSVVTGGTGTKRGHDNMSRMMKLGWAGLGSAAACSQIVCRLSLLHHNSTHRQHTQTGCRAVCLVSQYEPFPSACQDISHPSESEPCGDTSWIEDD